MSSSALLALAALSLVTSTSALPVSAREVGLVNCTTTYFTSSSSTVSLWVHLNETLGEVQLGVTRGDLLDRKEDAGAGSTFAFEACNSPFMRSTVSYGHALFLAQNGTRYCLSATYPYKGQTPTIDTCSYSDDSSQFLQWWRLSTPSGSATATPSSTFPANSLSFSGPSTQVASYTEGQLGPAEDSFLNNPLTLASASDETSFYFSDPDGAMDKIAGAQRKQVRPHSEKEE